MTPQLLFEDLIRKVCLGNNEALDFLLRYRNYIHAIDDVEDEETTPEFRLGIYIQALDLYTTPFFLKNLLQLKQSMYSITNLYTESVLWEKSEEKSKKEFAEWARHFGAEMILTVASIVGGYQHMRNLSQEIRMFNWSKHHGE